MHIAVCDNSEDIVKCLVDGGASLESRDMVNEWIISIVTQKLTDSYLNVFRFS